jgi:tetraacyldisaccharide 4'-kinase
MDDGHQNFELQKDLSIVVIDSKRSFGNGHLLPAGPMREPAQQGLARADVVVMVGAGDALPQIRTPIVRARVASRDITNLAGQRVIAFAGIGQPERFFDTLEDLGAVLVGRYAFGDHHVYSEAEFTDLKASAKARDARLFTTEKDFVRLTREQQQGVEVLPVQAVFGSDDLKRLLAKVGSKKMAVQ